MSSPQQRTVPSLMRAQKWLRARDELDGARIGGAHDRLRGRIERRPGIDRAVSVGASRRSGRARGSLSSCVGFGDRAQLAVAACTPR